MAESVEIRRRFETAIERLPEFMDCLRVTGETNYISFTYCTNVAELNRLCDELSANKSLKIQRVVTRVILERPKFYLGYPIAKLKWLE